MKGHEFDLITDHASFKWLTCQKNFHGRLARWALKLQRFHFSIKHRKVSQDIVPDSLSRIHFQKLIIYIAIIEL